MAATTKPEVNKSQSIRAFFKQNPTAHAKEVVTGLGEKGITVTESHVYVVQGKMKLKKLRKAKDKAATESGPWKLVKNAPSAETPNKSQAIRAFLTESPKASVEEVISTLAAKGISVKKGTVYKLVGQVLATLRFGCEFSRTRLFAKLGLVTLHLHIVLPHGKIHELRFGSITDPTPALPKTPPAESRPGPPVSCVSCQPPAWPTACVCA